MIGHPKYNYDDLVEFDIKVENVICSLQGKIYIVDRYGTFEQNKDVSYDIMVDKSPFHNNKPCLYKHIMETKVKKYKIRRLDLRILILYYSHSVIPF